MSFPLPFSDSHLKKISQKTSRGVSLQRLISHLQSEGYNPGEIIPDGKIHRYKHDDKDHKKSAYYIAHRNFSEHSGEEFYVLCYGSWRGEETKTHCTLKVISKEDKKLIEKKFAEMKRRGEASRLVEQKKVAGEVKAKWNGLATAGVSAYLDKKQIKYNSNLGLRYDQSNIYIPARDIDGYLWSWQQITWDGQKWFYPGGRIRGCFHVIGDVAPSDVIYLAEGCATAITIFMATQKPTVCAFFAANLIEVARLLKKKYPDKSIVVCGDNDLWTKKPNGDPYNPGEQTATSAAKICLGSFVLPEFKSLESKPTDFSDLYILEGLERVAHQLRQVKIQKKYLLPIGFKEKEYFFTSSENQQIIGVTKFTKSDFFNLMPLEYWETTFPGAGATKIDWDEATSELMKQARVRGIFESKNVRGAGVWNDENRSVVNMGDHLIVDGRRMELGELKSRYFYSLGIKMPKLSREPLTARECETLTNACHLFKWKRADFGYLLAGAMITTRVCGALPIRPHVWVTGERGTGKTTLFNRFIYPIIGEPLLFAAGNSTEAGVRQRVCADAIPVLFDEFENIGVKSQKRIQEVLDLMRLSWSETNAAIIKGSSGGVSTAYSARFAAIVTSIRQISMTDADQSRFATIELSPHGDDSDHWRQLDALLNDIDAEYGSRLFARTLKLLPTLLINFRVMKKALSKQSPSQRFSDQYGMLLAGYGLLLQDEPMSAAQSALLAEHVTLDEEKEEAKVADQTDALEHLFSSTTRLEFTTSQKTIKVGKLIESVWKNKGASDPEKNALSILGIRVESEFVAITATNHAELERCVFRGTRWSQSWGKSLKRLPGASKRKIRIDGIPCWAVHIPTQSLPFS